MIIGIAGKTRVGKTTLASLLNQINDDYSVYSFAEEVRNELANAWFNNHQKKNRRAEWDLLELTNKESVRPLLAGWGHGRRKLTGETYWVKRLMEGIPDGKTTVIDDVRYPNEIDAILEAGGIIIRLTACQETLIERGATEESLSHPSENALSNQLTLRESLAENRVFRINTDGLNARGVLRAFNRQTQGVFD